MAEGSKVMGLKPEYDQYKYAAAALADIQSKKPESLQFGKWEFFGGTSLIQWVNRWAVEIKYSGVAYAYSPPSPVTDFSDATGVADLRFAVMHKADEVKYMLRYIEKRASKFVNSAGDPLVDNLDEEDLELWS